MRHLWDGRARTRITVRPRPWVFVASRNRRGARVLLRVHAMREPRERLRIGTEGLVVLYSLPGLEEESIQVELNGDVLVLRANGVDRKDGRKSGNPFSVHSEVLLPHGEPGAEATHVYSREVLEVRIVPARKRAAPEQRGPARSPRRNHGGKHD